MRSALWGIVVASSTLAGWLTLSAACGSLPTECTERYNCPLGVGGGSASSSSDSSSSASSTSSGTGGGPPATCVPTAAMAPVDDTCGIFVSSSLGADGPTAGSKAKPYKTLAAAIAAAGPAKKPVYACAETFNESLTVAVGVGLYGGLDCANKWSYVDGTRSTLTTDADAVPLTLSASASGASLFDFEVQAADAVLPGGSSIAMIADQVTAAFTRCDFLAKNGKDGLPGIVSTAGVGPKVSTDPQIRGNDGTNACVNPAVSVGGLPKDNDLCPSAMGGPVGGIGGSGLVVSGGNGDASAMTAQTALGGKGQLSIDAMINCFTGGGQAGIPGAAGSDGAGATGPNVLGTIAASGYSGVDGGDAALGKPGQGGGGGGGAKGKSAPMCAGASGGGGGTGGCGGHGGTGGKAGGASIGIVYLDATISFDTVTIQVGNGGKGGDGASGQAGGAGGKGGTAGVGDSMAPLTSGACDGGNGGAGGPGGMGGGGHGGHAIGIAASGAKPFMPTGVMVSMMGKPGLGGKGGALQDGDPGVQANVQLFP